MNRFILLLVLTIQSIISFSQKKFPDGVYLTAEQLRNLSPAFQADFRISPNEALFREEIVDYTLIPEDTLSRAFVKRNVYAYVKNDSVFLNCQNFNLPSGFALVETPGNFLVFKSNKQVKTSKSNGQRDHVYCIVSLRTGNMRLLQPTYLEARLKSHPKLLTRYQNEGDKSSSEVMLRYVALLNEEVPLGQSVATSAED